jgi:molecular chaperone GrpE
MTEPMNPTDPQVVPEQPEAATAASGPAGDESPSSAEAPVADKVAELTSDLQRLSAEFANYRKRTAAGVADAREAGKALVLGKLLDLVDDLDRARKHGDLESGPLKAIADKLGGVLNSEGLQSFGADGDDFDPSVHEAVQHSAEGSDLVVGAVLRQGYRVGPRVLRNAMVAVTDRPVANNENTSSGAES